MLIMCITCVFNAALLDIFYFDNAGAYIKLLVLVVAAFMILMTQDCCDGCFPYDDFGCSVSV